MRLCGYALLLARTGAVQPHFDLNHEYSTRFAVTVVVREAAAPLSGAVDDGSKRAPRKRTVRVAGDAHEIELSLSLDISQFAPTYAEARWSAAGMISRVPPCAVCCVLCARESGAIYIYLSGVAASLLSCERLPH